jgi:hypothetical protein
MIMDTVVVVTAETGGGTDWMPLWTGILGGVIGLASTFIALWSSRRTTREQLSVQRELAMQELQATVTGANRIRWVEQLRLEMAGFIATISQIITDRDAGVDPAAIQLKLDKAMMHGSMAQLLLYPDDEAEQGALNAAIVHVAELVNSHGQPTAATTPQVNDALEKAGKRATAVFKQHLKLANAWQGHAGDSAHNLAGQAASPRT